MELKIKKLHPDAIVPTYGSDGAACFDLYAINWESVNGCAAIKTANLPTGLAFEVPPGWAMMIYSRSGHGFNNDVRLANCVGVIDSDYRGQVYVKLTADGRDNLRVCPGDRIAQAMLVPVERVTLTVVDDLPDTARGSGGFGSTGA